MRLAPILAAAALAALPASADAAVTVGSSLPEADGFIECDQSCTAVTTAIPGGTAVVPIDGVVVRWRMRDPLGPETTSAGLVVMRPQPDGSLQRVGSSSVGMLTEQDGGITTTEGGNRIPPLPMVRAGDLLGVDTHGRGVIAVAARPGAGSSILMPPPPFNGTGMPVAGPPDAELLFNVDIEPDADRDGFGDETRDMCPERADARNRPCVPGFGLRAEPPQTAVVGQEASLSFQVTPPTGRPGQPPPVSEPVTVLVAVPPGFRVLRATGGSRCEITATRVTCLNVGVGPNGLVELTGIPSGTFYDREGRLPWSLRFMARAWASIIDAHPRDHGATGELLLKDGTCTVNLAGRGDKRRNRVRGTMFGDRIAGAAGADRLAGRSGRDCIRGGDGADVISGGPGRDRLNGSDGKDRIHARDGVRDLVACGPGKDLAVVDRKDRVGGCERVRRR